MLNFVKELCCRGFYKHILCIKLFYVFSRLCAVFLLFFIVFPYAFSNQVNIHLQVVSPFEVVLPEVIGDQSGGGGGAGGGSTNREMDSCPDGDFSPSYYDGMCESDGFFFASAPIDVDELFHGSAPLGGLGFGIIGFGYNGYLRYFHVVDMVAGFLLRFHENGPEVLLYYNINSKHETLKILKKIYNLPWLVPRVYANNIIITNQEFVYFVALLRYISGKNVNLDDDMHAKISKLNGFMKYDYAMELVQRYVFDR